MILKKNSNFEVCPEFTGRAVCVDVTPARKQQTQFGERNVFKLVFELDLARADGTPYCVWSTNFTPSVHEKANFRRFVRGWFGRDFTQAELDGFNTEDLLHRPAQLVVTHQHKDGQVYANIVACTPDRSGEGLKPSGKYVRVKDRPPKGEDASTYRRSDSPASNPDDLAATKVHVGRCAGLELRELAREQIEALIQHWLPSAKANAKPRADDKRLIAALEWWATAQEKEADDVPY